MSERLTNEQLRDVLDGTANAWPNVGQTRDILTELLALRAAWKIAEPSLLPITRRRINAILKGIPSGGNHE